AWPIRERNLGGDLALVIGEERAIGIDHVAHREQTAVRRDQLEELPREASDAGTVEHGSERLDLLLRAEHGAAHETREGGAGADECIEAIEIGSDRVEVVGFERELE